MMVRLDSRLDGWGIDPGDAGQPRPPSLRSPAVGLRRGSIVDILFGLALDRFPTLRFTEKFTGL
jgi:hypothetical protein